MNARLPAVLLAYRAASTLLEPALRLWLRRRIKRGKEDPRRIEERSGTASRPRPGGDVVWVHGASIGETMAVVPLVERLTQRGFCVLVTSGTLTSAELLGRRLPPGAIHQFVPLDVVGSVRRFLDHWQPHLALFAESELWPNMMVELETRLVPLILVNARLSPRSFRRWQRMPGLARALLGRVSLCIAQSAEDADRFDALGAFQVVRSGNLKYDVPPLPADPRAVEALAALVAGRPLWIAASTHPGEEDIVLRVHAALADRHPDLLTIIAPRHPHRGTEIAALAGEAGFAVGLRSEGTRPERAVEVYVADTVGELGLFYRTAPVALLGGSLVEHGGQNPIEAAKLGTALLHGTHVHNFVDVYEALDATGGAYAVANERVLAGVLDGLLRDPALTRDMARAAFETVNSLGGGLDRTMAAIEPYLAPLAQAPGR